MSISPSFYKQLFCIKYFSQFFCAYSLCLYFFGQKQISVKAACKMLMKFTLEGRRKCSTSDCRPERQAMNLMRHTRRRREMKSIDINKNFRSNNFYFYVPTFPIPCHSHYYNAASWYPLLSLSLSLSRTLCPMFNKKWARKSIWHGHKRVTPFIWKSKYILPWTCSKKVKKEKKKFYIFALSR